MFCETTRVSERSYKFVTSLLASAVALILCASAWSQGNLGRIVGTVTDQNGGAVVGAMVTVIDVARGVSKNLVTDSGGEYVAPALIPGQYEVTVQATGFSKFDRQNITILVGQEVRVDAALSVGAQTQTVTVTEEAPTISTTNATLGGVIANQSLVELPVSGRNYLHFLDDKPGVQMKPGGGANSYVSNGNRQAANGFYVDGLFSGNINTGASPILGGGGGGGGGLEQANVLPVDAVQEINVMEDPKAEYGPWPGAYINIGLKSGTNSIHGSAYAFGRDQDIDARNAFLSSSQPESLEQWGVSVGGPIKKDKLFYFANFEKQEFSIAAAHTAIEPSTQPGLGTANSFPDAIAALNLAGNGGTIKPLSLALAGCTNSGATTGAGISCNAADGIFGNASGSIDEVEAFPIVGNSNNVISKIDYTINDHNTIHGDFAYGGGSPIGQSGTQAEPYWRGQFQIAAYIARAMWIWAPSSAWVNEARFGYDRLLSNVQPTDCTPGGPFAAPNYASLGLVTGVSQCGLGLIELASPFTNLGSNLGTNSLAAYFTGEDAVTHTVGKHIFKFGGGVRATNWTGDAYAGLRGTVQFKGLTSFLQGTINPTLGTSSLTVGTPLENDTWQSYWLFAQDDWRLTSKVTVNLGLRYDYQGPMRDATNNVGGFDPTAPSGLFQQSSSRALWDPSKADIAPRLGVAWDVTGKGTTVVRAGGGVFYEPFITQLVSSQATTYAVPTGATLVGPTGTTTTGPGNLQNGVISLTSAQVNWALNTPIFGTLASSGNLSCGNGVTPNPAPCALSVISPNLQMQIVGEWNLGIQHAITNSLTVDVSYVGNHNDYGTGAVDVNQPIPGTIAGEQLRRPYYTQFPYLGAISTEFSNDYGNYNALQVSVTKRVTHGLSFTGGYTSGHALDIHSLDGAASPKGVMDSTRPYLDYGNSDYDYRQRFTLTGTYLVPGIKSPGQMLEGWQVNSILDLLSGSPMEAYDSTDDLSGTGELVDRWDMFGKASDFKVGLPSTLPCWGVGTITSGVISGSTFAKSGVCTIVPTVAAMPLACYEASNSLPINPNVGTSGLASLTSLGCYMSNGSVIVPPAQGTYGNMGRNMLHGQPLREWDLSVSKNWKIKERLTAQFRAEMFNILNLVNYANSTGLNPASPSSFGLSTGTPDVINQAPVFGTGGPRKIQLGLKFIF